MTLTENELNKIKAIFERIDYGRVTFSLSQKDHAGLHSGDHAQDTAYRMYCKTTAERRLTTFAGLDTIISTGPRAPPNSVTHAGAFCL
jgi:hypothetical protein